MLGVSLLIAKFPTPSSSLDKVKERLGVKYNREKTRGQRQSGAATSISRIPNVFPIVKDCQSKTNAAEKG